MIKKAYQYLYFRAYDLLSLTGKYDLAWGASHLLSIFFALLIEIVLLKSGIGMYAKKEFIGASAVILFLLFHLLNYYLFLKDAHYKLIVESYEGESLRGKRIGRFLCLIVLLALAYSLF